MSETFEALYHDALPELYSEYTISQVPTQWQHKGREIDVVTPTAESTLIVGEATSTNTPLV